MIGLHPQLWVQDTCVADGIAPVGEDVGTSRGVSTHACMPACAICNLLLPSGKYCRCYSHTYIHMRRSCVYGLCGAKEEPSTPRWSINKDIPQRAQFEANDGRRYASATATSFPVTPRRYRWTGKRRPCLAHCHLGSQRCLRAVYRARCHLSKFHSTHLAVHDVAAIGVDGLLVPLAAPPFRIRCSNARFDIPPAFFAGAMPCLGVQGPSDSLA